MFRSSFLAVAFLTTALLGSLQAQDSNPVALTADGQLVGNVFVQGETTPLEAKVTIAKDGVVINSTQTKEDGSFAFKSLQPGVYNMYGTAGGYVGTTGLTVVPTATKSAPTTASFGLATMAAAQIYDAPAQSCSYIPDSGSSYSYGGGGGGGGRLFGGKRFRRLALIGGIVAIAASSPDN